MIYEKKSGSNKAKQDKRYSWIIINMTIDIIP
jgi:hypothetical protein